MKDMDFRGCDIVNFDFWDDGMKYCHIYIFELDKRGDLYFRLREDDPERAKRVYYAVERTPSTVAVCKFDTDGVRELYINHDHRKHVEEVVCDGVGVLADILRRTAGGIPPSRNIKDELRDMLRHMREML